MSDTPILPAGPEELSSASMLQARQTSLQGPVGNKAEELKEAAKQFEGVLLNLMMKEMEKTIPESGMFSSAAMGQMRSLFWQNLSETIADSGGMGIWKQLYQDFRRCYGVEPEAPTQTDTVR